MRANLELVARRLVDVRRPQDVVALDLRRQRHGTLDDGAGALGRLHDLERRLVDQLVIERFQPDAYTLILHVSPSSESKTRLSAGWFSAKCGRSPSLRRGIYSM